MLEQNLKPAAGVRPEAAKMLILVTDGKSQDDVRTAARILKDQDIDVFVVGELAQCLGPGLECSWLGWASGHRHICTLAFPSLLETWVHDNCWPATFIPIGPRR